MLSLLFLLAQSPMSAFFEPTLKELWGQIHAHLAEQAAFRARMEANPEEDQGTILYTPHTPLNRTEMARKVGLDMGRAWMRRRKTPESLDQLRDELLAENPEWAKRMMISYRCKRALETMPDEAFVWRTTGRRDDGSIGKGEGWPTQGQLVLYFFEAVGSHPGHFEGEEEGLDVFCGLFNGFLGGDVTHWMPMPGMDEKIAFELA